jgi:HD-GYP domain-containing protein (c-di-GMP phosphodiesterase class II)
MAVASTENRTVEERSLGHWDAAFRGVLGEAFNLWIRRGAQWTSSSLGKQRNDGGLASRKLADLLEAAASRLTPVIDTPAADRRMLAIPYTDGESLVVAVACSSTDELLQQLARCLQQGLARSRELEEAQRVAEDCTRQISEDLEQLMFLESLSEILQLCEVSRSPLDVAQSVLPVLRELVRAESLVLLRPQDLAGGRGAGNGAVDAPPLWTGSPTLADDACCELVRRFEFAARQQPVVKNRLQGEVDGARFPGLDSFLLVRVAKDELVLGWLLALNRLPDETRSTSAHDMPYWGLNDHEFGTVQSGLMQAAACMLATHARNVQLFQEKESLFIGALRSLINAIDAKDAYTCGHSDRVALIARRLGQELGLSVWDRNTLYVSALLHDIGKIGVPDAILRKPGELTDEERVQFQRHPEGSHAILKHLEQLAPMLPGVLYHHERYDGAGYPSGLKGEAIPLAARIIAVADSFDAMSSDRPYRTALPDSRVEKILQEGAGTQWDRQVVEALVRILPEVREICRRRDMQSPGVLVAAAPESAKKPASWTTWLPP